jgi:succinyl-diaminopimelate desuccinylase
VKNISRSEEMIDSYRKDMVYTLSTMISIKSVSPVSGGTGESKRADFLEKTLKEWGFKTKRYDYDDGSGFLRSNIVVKSGVSDRTLWLIPHIDTVSEGDMSLWGTDPFTAVVKNGKVYGRGSCDNGQAVVSSMYALKLAKDLRLKSKYNFGLALVADEEVGSVYGIRKLIEEGVFKKNDLFLVPDFGSPKGNQIEVAEKGMLWLKITVHGKQVHASTPELGENAFRKAIILLNEIDKHLHEKYSMKDEMFDPNVSTFEMTKHEKNTDSINIAPGTDVSYMDCRILPGYDLDKIAHEIRKIAEASESKNTKIDIETILHNKPTRTPIDSELVLLLSKVITETMGSAPIKVGIGGGTCASFLRQNGMDAVAWSTVDDVAHQPNEYAIIDNMVADTKILYKLFED